MKNFDDLTATVAALLGENGCPWDKSQTFDSLREDLLEECYEAVDAVNKRDDAALCEELGDVLLSIVLYAKIAEADGRFTIGDVVDGITRKIIRRHSHVFGDVKAVTPEESLRNWEAEKSREHGNPTVTDKLKGVPAAMPALMRARKVLKRAAAAGYPLKTSASNVNPIAINIQKLAETISTLSEADIGTTERQKLIGTILLQLAGISAELEINPEIALTNEIEQFINVVEDAENAGFAVSAQQIF